MSSAGNSGDVRMRGFRHRATVAEALTWVAAHTSVTRTERVRLVAGWKRILSQSISAPGNLPQFDRSAMDGFAVQAENTQGASLYNPVSLEVVGESLAGQPECPRVEDQQAVRIMTGAPLPPGANAVVPAEYAEESAGRVQLTHTVTPGKHVGRCGEDVRTGDTLLPAGRCLRPQDLGLLAACGIDTVDVLARPRIRLLVTGDELVQPGQARGASQIYDANSSMLQALIARDGGILEQRLSVDDSAASIREALLADDAEVILVSGGTSVGQEDHAPVVLREQGRLAIHGIAMRPSSPTGMGVLGTSLVFLLPGNPVSCLCAYDFFAGRAIRALAGLTSDWPYRSRELRLSSKLVSAIGRCDYCRVCVEADGVRPLATSGASILSSTTRADGFVIVPDESEGLPAGENVRVWMYDPWA